MMLKNYSNQPWLYSLFTDTVFIILPQLITLLIIAFLPLSLKETDELSLVGWVILVLFIDVAHVYSTLFRTYFDNDYAKKNKALLVNIPLLCLISSIVVYNISALLFWRVLAYLAVFHFIRQQYGFIKIYSRKESTHKFQKIIENISIYNATVFPILYWHLHPEKVFNWFVQNDFIYFQLPKLETVFYVIYIAIITAHVFVVIRTVVIEQIINIPKLFTFLGTYLSWYFGIVYYNGDFAFTALNVIAHGVPYMALVWIYNKKKNLTSSNKLLKLVATTSGVFVFIALLLVFAYIEEGFWDALVWREKEPIFSMFWHVFSLPSPLALSVIVPLLSLPQLTHYVIDGFIWKIKTLNNTKDFEA